MNDTVSMIDMVDALRKGVVVLMLPLWPAGFSGGLLFFIINAEQNKLEELFTLQLATKTYQVINRERKGTFQIKPHLPSMIGFIAPRSSCARGDLSAQF